MYLDKYSNPIFSENEIFEAIYQGIEFSKLPTIIVNRTDTIAKLEENLGIVFRSPVDINAEMEVETFDAYMQNDWNMPDEYKNMDIEGYLVHNCPKQNYQRLIDELQEFRSRNMLNLLKWLKYFVDTCKNNNIVWGVGRGSSVASYVLFLLGVHKIDSVKYKLDWKEFLR